jgi:anaerobic selenocysteine-containing dehydrogenase
MASWMVDVLNVLTGNLDRVGGAMFSHAAHEQPRSRRGFQIGRWVSRARGLPETRGELPVSTMAEEILEPGKGQIKAMITVAGNPVLSTPNSDRLDEALAGLDFMVSLDIYLNETTRHADVILPGVSPLRRPHYDFAFNQLSVRNVANYSPPLFPLPEGTPDEWRIMLRLGAVVSGQGTDTDLDALDDGVFAMLIGSVVANPASPVAGRSPEEIFAATSGARGPERMLDFLVRSGPYGDGYGAVPDGLTLEKLEQSPHGIDLGPLQPRLPQALCTLSGLVELAPEPLLSDVDRLRSALGRRANGGFALIGRRHLRSNNSWMHNIDVLVKGKERCTLQINTADAARIGVGAGGQVKVTSSAGMLVVPVEISDDIMPGVVSLPHGWGHDLEGSALTIASGRPGVNSNRLSTGEMDPVSGNAVLNGIPVEVIPA